MRDKQVKAWLGILSLVSLIAPIGNAANAADNNLLSKPTEKVEVAPTGAFSVSKEEKLKKYENLPNLTDAQLVELLSLVGFKGQDLKEAWAVAKKESNGRPLAFNGNSNTGDSSYGIFQINMIGDLGPDRRDKFKLSSNAELFNPVLNAKIAFHMSDGGEDWSSWKGITSRTKMWLDRFPS